MSCRRLGLIGVLRKLIHLSSFVRKNAYIADVNSAITSITFIVVIAGKIEIFETFITHFTNHD